MSRLRRTGIALAFVVYAAIGLAFLCVATLAFAADSPPAIDPALDWMVKVALTVIGLAMPVQIALGGALLSTLRAHGKRLGEHDVAIAELHESKVFRGSCEVRQKECPAHRWVMDRAAISFPGAASPPPATSTPLPIKI